MNGPITLKQKNILYLFIFCGLVIFSGIYLYYLNPIFFPIDDSYIILHNAEVLHLGYDPNYLGISALAGTTSIIHLAIVAALLFIASAPYALGISLLLAALLYACGLVRLAYLFKASFVQTLFFVVSGLIIGYVPYLLCCGLETGFVLAIMTWTLYFASLSESTTKQTVLPLLCGLMPFVRPELALFSGLIMLYFFYQEWQQTNSLPNKLRKILIAITLASLAALPWLIWYYIDTGSIIPQTMAAKYAFFANGAKPMHLKFNFAWQHFAGFILILGYFSFIGMLFLLFTTSLGGIGLLFSSIIITNYIIYFPDAFDQYVQRYLYITLPILLYGVIAAINSPNKIFRVIANVTLAIIFCQSLWNLPVRWHFYVRNRAVCMAQATSTVAWCIKHLPTNARILVIDAGYFSYASNFHLIDAAGLKTPRNIEYHMQYTLPSIGARRTEAIAAIINDEHPIYFINNAENQAQQQQTLQQFKKYGIQLQPLMPFQMNYLVYRIITSHTET